MNYPRCKECSGTMYYDDDKDDGIWHCYACDRHIDGSAIKIVPRSNISEIAPNHGLQRKDMLAADAYVKED